jgi:hypothetical protein
MELSSAEQSVIGRPERAQRGSSVRNGLFRKGRFFSGFWRRMPDLPKAPRRGVTHGVAYVVCDCVRPSRGSWMVSGGLLREAVARFSEPKKPSAEEVIFTGNIGPMVAGTPVYDKAVDSLRRLGAKVQATNITASGPIRWYLSFRVRPPRS